MDGGTSISKCPRFFSMAVSRILSSRRFRDDLYGHLSRRNLAISLALASCDYYPEISATLSRHEAGRPPDSSCFVLHRMGFFVPPDLRPGRWALTPPFHPYPATSARRFVFCDTFRRGGLSPAPPVRSTRHAALWCPDFPLGSRLSPRPERPSAINVKIRDLRDKGKIKLKKDAEIN